MNEYLDQDEEDEDQDVSELVESFETMIEAFRAFDKLLKEIDRQTWNSWKAGGKLVSSEFVSNFPNAESIMEDFIG